MGDLSHCLAIMTPKGPPTTVVNGGGVIGYNIGYSLVGAIPPVEITSIPLLTFDISVENNGAPVEYPLAEPITLIVQITRVVF
jgi:hypothetical protein